jgi:hypothetical protein
MAKGARENPAYRTNWGNVVLGGFLVLGLVVFVAMMGYRLWVLFTGQDQPPWIDPR